MSANPVRRGEIVQQGSPETWAVYEPDTDSLHELNATARAIWELCDGQTALEEMATAISELTGMDHADSMRDVRATVARLEASGLVSTSSRGRR